MYILLGLLGLITVSIVVYHLIPRKKNWDLKFGEIKGKRDYVRKGSLMWEYLLEGEWLVADRGLDYKEGMTVPYRVYFDGKKEVV